MPSSPPPDLKSEDGDVRESEEWQKTIDNATFEQILEMDDDEDEREFSRSIVFDFFTQAKQTFGEMDTALEEKDLEKLASKGHFLKGSSATLGLKKVKDSCEKIQHTGERKKDNGEPDDSSEDVLLSRLEKIISQAKKEFAEAEKLLKSFFPEE